MSKHNYEYEFPVPLNGTRAEVFEALTDAAALKQWFAEDVDIELRVGGNFRFWGRHTYGQPSSDQADQVLTRLDAPNELAFSWRLLGRDSEVTWLVKEEDTDDGTVVKITVRHDFESLPEIGRAAELIDDLWRIHTGGLCFYLNGEEDIYRPDFADQAPVVETSIVINAPPEKVFKALIEPDYIKQWFPAPAPVVDPRVGGDYGFGFSFEMDGKKVEPPPMKILAFENNRKLTITWPDWRMDPSVPDQQVTWLLEDLGGRTRLTLQHGGFTRAVDVSDYPFGWLQFLNQIREVAQTM